MIAIIPDCHGRLFWEDIIPEKDNFDKIIFLGDYLDPYSSYEKISKEQALENFKKIIEFKKNNSDKVVLLLGNHDASYAISIRVCDCRCDYDNYNEIQKLFRNNFDLFELFYKFKQKDKDFLFSHAGIADEWLKDWCPNNINVLDWLDNLWKVSKKDIDSSIIGSVLGSVSYYRGGTDLAGSIVWRDALERISDKFGYQIFGHTMLMNPVATNNWACLDCKRIFVLSNDELYNFNGEKLEIYGE